MKIYFHVVGGIEPTILWLVGERLIQESAVKIRANFPLPSLMSLITPLIFTSLILSHFKVITDYTQARQL